MRLLLLKRILLVVPLVLCAAFPLRAQIGVEPGEWISYRVTMDMESTQMLGGEEVLTTTSGNVVTHLKLVTEQGEELLWRMKNRGRYHFRELGTGMTADTTISMEPLDYRTDREGKLVGIGNDNDSAGSATASAPQSSFMSVVGGSLKNSLTQWYLPAEAAWNPVQGKKWTKTDRDTIMLAPEKDSLAGNVEVIRTASTEYILRDTLDTLDHHVVRVDWEASEMTLEGNVNYAGLDMRLNGEGETNGTFWYSLEDGLLVAGRTSLAFSWKVFMAGQDEMSIPFSQRVTTETSRKPKRTLQEINTR